MVLNTVAGTDDLYGATLTHGVNLVGRLSNDLLYVMSSLVISRVASRGRAIASAVFGCLS